MLWLMILLAAVQALGQNGVVEGKVVDVVTKAPIAGAAVTLFSGNKAVHSATSDTQGLFRIAGVAEGQYHAVFSNDAYLRLAPDHPATQPFVLSPARLEVRLDAELIPLGQVAGRVLSPAGEPMKGVPVGIRQVWAEHWGMTTLSGDGGLFRFRNVAPGAWILAGLPNFKITLGDETKNPKPVSAPSAEEGQKVNWAATFFPSAVDIVGAEKIVVRPGAMLEGYDVKLRTLPSRRISGIVLDQEGKPAPKAMLALSDVASRGSNGTLKRADNEGRFEFDSLLDGEWHIYAQFKQSEQTLLKGYVDLHVSRRDLTGVEIRLTAPFAVKGFVDREEPRNQDGKRSVTAVHLIPEERADAPELTFHEQDGRFVVKNVYAGRYRVLPVGHVPGYYVASISYGDHDVTTHAFTIVSPDTPLRILYKSGTARATGTVKGREGSWVVLVPQDEAFRDTSQFIQTTKSGAHGSFSMENLRPGSYYVFAFDRISKEMFGELEFVRKLAPGAVRVELRHGETTSLELRSQAWPDY